MAPLELSHRRNRKGPSEGVLVLQGTAHQVDLPSSGAPLPGARLAPRAYAPDMHETPAGLTRPPKAMLQGVVHRARLAAMVTAGYPAAVGKPVQLGIHHAQDVFGQAGNR